MVNSQLDLNFKKSPIIGLNEEAVYRCSNEMGVPIKWYINGTKVQDGDNKVNGTPSNSTLTIQGVPENNNTVVKCHAAHPSYSNSKSAVLKIQGILEKVTSLSCTVQGCTWCIRCNWSPPFSLIPIHSYLIRVSLNGKFIVNDIVKHNKTHWIDCLNQFGVYSIIIAANLRMHEGIRETAKTDLTMRKDLEDKTLIHIMPFIIHDNWNILLNFTKLDVTEVSCVYIKLIDSNFSTYIHVCSDKKYETIGLGQLQLDYLKKKSWQVLLSVQYIDGRNIKTTSNFSTFIVQSGNFSVENNTASFTCCFVDDIQHTFRKQKCHIDYFLTTNSDSTTPQSHKSFNISTSSGTGNCVTKYLTNNNIKSGNYSVFFYDMDNDKPYCSLPAYELHDVSVSFSKIVKSKYNCWC
jgi:hypothetical protein